MAKVTLTRREFLRRTGGGLLFCGGIGVAARMLAGCEIHGEIPRISGGLRRFVTPTEGPVDDAFYIQFGNPTTTVDNHPRLSPESWSLAITGEVGQPVTVTFHDLMAAAETDAIVFLKTMRCVFDAPAEPLISNGYWRGVPLEVFVARAGPTAAARRLLITGEDGFTDNLSLARVTDNREEGVPQNAPLLPVVLAYELNGEPIPTVHGGPMRIVVPEKFGYKNMKYPREIELTARDEPFGYYETQLFDGSPLTDLGNIALTSMFSGPLEGEAVAGPTVNLFGVALYGPDEVQRVEVSVDSGPYEAVDLIPLDEIVDSPELFFGDDSPDHTRELEDLRSELVQLDDSRFGSSLPYVWALWQYQVDLSNGEHQARVRAFGADGSEQVASDRELDDGNSQIRRVSFSVR